MRKILISSLLFLLLLGSGALAATECGLLDVAHRINTAENRSDAEKVLSECGQYRAGTWIFSYAVGDLLRALAIEREATTNTAFWTAACRLDSWGDGAWHLEAGAAASEALCENPSLFVSAYEGGIDCALDILRRSFNWAAYLLELNHSEPVEKDIVQLRRLVPILLDQASEVDSAQTDGDRFRHLKKVIDAETERLGALVERTQVVNVSRTR